MKLTEEKFKELKQNDRIEYLLRKKEISENYSIGSFFYIFKLSFIILFVILVLALLLRANYGEQVYINFLKGFSSLGFFLGILFFAGFFMDLLNLFLGIKEKDELNKEFFDFKVTPKKK